MNSFIRAIQQLFGANDSIDEFFTTQRTLKNGAITVEINGKDYLMVSAKSQKNNIQLINLIPLSIIDAELKGATSSLLINGICIWLITVFLVYLFTYLLTKPLKNPVRTHAVRRQRGLSYFPGDARKQ